MTEKKSNWGGARPGSGSKPGVPRGQYKRRRSGGKSNRYAPYKPAEKRHRKVSLRITSDAHRIASQPDFNLNQAVIDNAMIAYPDRQQQVKGGRIRVCYSVSPAAFAIIKSKQNQSAFVETVCNLHNKGQP